MLKTATLLQVLYARELTQQELLERNEGYFTQEEMQRLLQILNQDGLVQQQNQKYSLTAKGEQRVWKNVN